MTTAIDSASIKAFPTANDVNSGTVGSGNIVTELNMVGLTAGLPPRNFVLTGFGISYSGDEVVSIGEGEAFIDGHYVVVDSDILYTIDPIPTGGVDVYLFLSLTVDGDGNVTGAQYSNGNVDTGLAPEDPARGVILGMAQTDITGDIVAAKIQQSKRAYAGGVYAGAYIGVSDGPASVYPANSQTISLPFAPSFVYVAGDAEGTFSQVCAASALLPANNKSVNAAGATQPPSSIGTEIFYSKYSCGWAMAAYGSGQEPTYYWGTGTLPARNDFDRGEVIFTEDITVTGARGGCSISVFSEAVNTFATTGQTSGEQYASRDWPGHTYRDTEYQVVATGEAVDFSLSAWVSADDKVRVAFRNILALSNQDFPGGSVTVCCQSAEPLTSTSKTFFSNSRDEEDHLKPVLTNSGFVVNDGDIGNTGKSLNADTQAYYYWAFGS